MADALCVFPRAETPVGIKHSRTEVLSRRRQNDQQAVVDDEDPEELDPLDAAGVSGWEGAWIGGVGGCVGGD